MTFLWDRKFFCLHCNIHIIAIIDSVNKIADVDPSKIHNIPRLTNGTIDTIHDMHIYIYIYSRLLVADTLV